MAAIKSYTDIEQSKKLAEILPLKSADMRFCFSHTLSGRTIGHYPMIGREPSLGTIPCWSLAALLEIIRNNGRYELQMYEGGYYFEANGFMTESYFNPVDACYEMILKLSEQKKL